MATSLDYCLKLIVIGDSGAGKSCVMRRYLESNFYEDQTHTIGVEFGAKNINCGGKKIKLQIWDTAGQERYRSVVRSYYRDAIGAVVVYDITNEESFRNVKRWIEDARELSDDNVTCVLVGNKKDKEDERKVNFMRGSQMAQSLEAAFFETSAVTGEGIEDVFAKLTKMILTKIENNDLKPKTKQSILLDAGKKPQETETTTDNQSWSSYCLC
ncbi:hypothetical protein FDP41_008492 [Naegleria fowleri]|uniref:Uncharacterized protein n=1 Tax=Naegleria fowleri TaxID=5763 RepID=A0A6A5BGY4_NAEFO|nr:uncharacterized protein FDP41_008492 [Naegleria fowleri]KAF0973285.1 hypothetical protein FDP41_008492 [Naegleria fowleri]